MPPEGVRTTRRHMQSPRELQQLNHWSVNAEIRKEENARNYCSWSAKSESVSSGSNGPGLIGCSIKPRRCDERSTSALALTP